jgi:hypothetical protein
MVDKKHKPNRGSQPAASVLWVEVVSRSGHDLAGGGVGGRFRYNVV